MGFTKFHVMFYVFSIIVGALMIAFASDTKDIFGIIPKVLGIVIIILSFIGITFFRKGEE